MNISLYRDTIHSGTSLVKFLLYFLWMKSAKEILVSGSFEVFILCFFFFFFLPCLTVYGLLLMFFEHMQNCYILFKIQKDVVIQG